MVKTGQALISSYSFGLEDFNSLDNPKLCNSIYIHVTLTYKCIYIYYIYRCDFMKKNPKRRNVSPCSGIYTAFLAGENLYGAELLSKVQEELPRCFADSAVFYRSLQEMEEDESVSSYWETDTSGPARKWYVITAKRLQRLDQ